MESNLLQENAVKEQTKEVQSQLIFNSSYSAFYKELKKVFIVKVYDSNNNNGQFLLSAISSLLIAHLCLTVLHLRNISRITRYLSQDATKVLMHAVSRIDHANSLLGRHHLWQK